ncbi:A-kinase anchor protein 12 isoform X1 [Peromyscus californicus insignis]|uniref:A-kinase anchor protein 12 isoform X1 n=1 Tax=Peromyscus californicus insignis TaxID=564181 RepID=UPI0022A774C9|nr:A-kinase anchor protein 12 isoform X1 [Peromyscus californicus insignis]
MGAGSSTEQRSPEQQPAGSDTPSEPELSGHGPAAEAPGAAGEPADADPATKLLQKNGQLSAVNGVAEQGDDHVQEGTQDGQEEEVIAEDVGQRESEDVREKDRAKEMAANSAVVEDITKDGQEEAPEIIEQIPAPESNAEEMAQPAESQANDVGFKKVFKFVGFKFTVKKDKNEKSDTVQLLTVKKDEGEGPEATVGAGDHQEPATETGESASKESELKQSIEKPEGAPKQAQSSTEEIPLQAESGQVAEEEAKDEGEEKREKEPAKSAESPTSPASGETTSSFKKFFTHGWAGWRKKTSFKKPKEDELETSEKKKEQEAEKVNEEENEKREESPSEQAPAASEQQEPAEGTNEARLSADYEKVELPLEDQVSGLEGSSEEKCAPLATEVFDDKIEAHQEVVAEVHVSTTSTLEKTAEEQEVGEETKGDVEETGESLSPGKPAETKEAPQEAQATEELVKSKEVCVSGGDHTQLTDLSPDEKMMPKHPEGIVSEVEMLSSQERMKVQGSPLKKLFSSSGLKKLSGKKQKGKRRGGGDEEPGEPQVQTESPESADEQKGDSSASSPEEPEEITSLERGLLEARQEGEAEEGATSDGEKKREGITPWASFKKMVTPKKRVRRPSESDKEEDVDKVKSATLSSTESTMSEMQEEAKTVGDEQKPEEPKRKVDTSVSWEALICVGSSKKRARKASSSDDEGGPRTAGEDGHRAEDAVKDAGTDAAPAGTQEPDQAQGSSSPEPAGSPSEGEGVSTWESFKRLVTPRKKSKSKMEEKTEEPGIEPLASDVEPSKEESWVSIKKFIPGRRKKRADGKQEQAAAEEAGPTEINEDDPDVPAVVPLSEYDAVEREKLEVQQAQGREERPQLQGPVYVSEELSKTLVHTVNVAVIDGTRAVTSAEERSPSWISASVTEPPELARDEATLSAVEVIAKESPAAAQTLPEGRDAQDDTVTSEVEFTSEAVTAAETTEALHAEEVTEASGAEETTDMVSAVSQLTDSLDTTEEATPVQEVEGGAPDREEQERQTQAVLQAVAEKVKGESKAPATQAGQRAGALEKVEEAEEDSEALAAEKERDVVLEDPLQGAEAEHSAQGPEIVQSTPESLREVPEVTAGVELKERVTPCQAVEPQQLMEQAGAPDSSETLTDSETNGSTPLADSDTPEVTQPDEAIESQDSKAFAADRQSQATEVEAAPDQKEGPSIPPNLPPQEGHGEKPGRDAPEPMQQELSVEAVPVLAETEVGHEAGHSDGGKVKDELCVEGLEASVHTDGPDGREKIAEVTRDGEVMGVPERQGNKSPEVQSLSPEGRETGTDVEKEKMETKPEEVSEEHGQPTASPEPEEAHPQLIQTVDMSDSEREKAVSSLEGSSSLPDPDKAGCTEAQVQSSEPPVTQTAGPVSEVADTVKISETDDSLECAGAPLIPAEKSSEKGDYWTLQHGEDTVPLGPAAQAESVPGITPSPAPEDTLHSDPQGERSPSQEQRSEEDDEQVGGPDGKEKAAREEGLEAESELLELESESSKLVQNVIQTAIDQFARTETAPQACASGLQAQVLVVQADSQGAQQMLDNEEGRHQVSAQDDETPTAAAEEGFALSDTSKGMNEMSSEKINVLAVENTSVKDRQCEEVIVPLKAKGDGNGAKPVPGDDCAKLGESVEKPPSESKDQKGHAADGPQHQSSAQAEADASGNLTKESPDTNGPKLTEEGDAWEVGVQEGKMPTESVKEIKPQTEEDLQEPEGDLEES